MTTKVLVTYATQYGSTREVAEAVAATLRERGLDTDLQAARDVSSLEGYQGVVLGAPFYVGSWHKDARGFLARHQDALARRPVALFALGPVSAGDSGEARKQLDEEMAKHPWLKPVAAEMFGGRYDPAGLSLAHRLLAALPASPLHGMPSSDLRDWESIGAWATGLAGRLLREAPR